MKNIAVIEDCCCPPLLETALSAEEAERMAAAFRVVGDPARLRLLSMIATHPRSEVCACELVEPLGLSQPTVSHHLKVLFEAGLLARERRGNWVFYRVALEPLETLRAALVTRAA